ncbi:MAG: hypothetical protein E6K39_18015 [Gammaproteobacteria bacterium]|nr:MAG: hypothetical protein E6K39_18015 [Gammaproteobacteria bacterium]
MALWRLRKIQIFIFIAGRSTQASFPWPIVPPAFAGMMLLCLLQTMVVMTILSGACVALHLQLSRDSMFWLALGVLGTATAFNYATLLFRHQWRQLAHEFPHLSIDDLAFAGMALMWCAIGFGALFFWFGSIIAK